MPCGLVMGEGPEVARQLPWQLLRDILTHPALLGRDLRLLDVRPLRHLNCLKVLALSSGTSPIRLVLVGGQAVSRHLKLALQRPEAHGPERREPHASPPKSVVVAAGFSPQAWQIARQAASSEPVELWLGGQRSSVEMRSTPLHALWRPWGDSPPAGRSTAHTAEKFLHQKSTGGAGREAPVINMPLLTREEMASLLGPVDVAEMGGQTG